MKKFICLFCMVVSLFATGFDYQVHEIDKFTKVHIIKVDPKHFEMRSVRASEIMGVSRQQVKDMVKKHGAIAGVNGGFWRVNGKPSGILKCDGKWFGEPTKKRGSIGWKNGGETVFIDRLMTVESDEGVIVVPQSDPNYTSAEDWSDLPNIVGGTPVLIRDGEIIGDFADENITIETFITKKHCRTAIGILEDGNWVIVVVSGKIKYKSGFTIPELAMYMQELGCKDAVNLDGGSSTRMVIKDKVVNENRFSNSVSDAILIYSRD